MTVWLLVEKNLWMAKMAAAKVTFRRPHIFDRFFKFYLSWKVVIFMEEVSIRTVLIHLMVILHNFYLRKKSL